MRKSIIILILSTLGFFSCEKYNKSPTDKVVKENLKSEKKAKSQESLTNFYSQYEYIDANNANLIIKNSFPKGGIKYTDSNGKQYVYAVFWTEITNETDNPFELELDFPFDGFELPASSGNYIRLLLPSDTFTVDKEPLFNYGLEVKPFLDKAIHKSSSLKKNINPKESSSFYVVTLSNKGVNGSLRTGLSIKGQNLYYKINEKEILCGKINLRDFKLQK